MFKFISKKPGALRHSSSKNKEKDEDSSIELLNLTEDFYENLGFLKKMLGKSCDIIFREFIIGDGIGTRAVLIYIDGMTDRKELNLNVLKPLMHEARFTNSENRYSPKNSIEFIKDTLISISKVTDSTSMKEIIGACLEGKTILLISGSEKGLILDMNAYEHRGISEPQTEVVIRGSREGFIEDIYSNTVLIRRRIQDPNLTLETFKIGERSNTTVTIIYIKDIASSKLVEEVKERLQKIKTDAVLESGYIEQYIEDQPLSIFSTVANSERPDVVTSRILEGRVAILTDGSPFVLTIPRLFIENFQIAEDYYSRPFYASFVRIIRFLSYAISILAAPVYVALTTFNQELIPTQLLITTIAAREAIPFPAVLEALGMIIVFEILREAGVRLPRPVGQSISIVGALVIGESAVSAGLISAPMVIVVAFTAISSFVVPPLQDSSSIIRVILLILAGFMGFLGIGAGLVGILIHLCTLRSFGAPFFSPLAPLSTKDLKDSILRFPLWSMLTRPRAIGWKNLKRQEENQMPNPPQNEDL